MRVLIPNVLSVDEMVKLREDTPVNRQYVSDFSEGVLKRLFEEVQAVAPIQATGKSYYSVEQKPLAHPKHCDGCTLEGEPNHMSWCTYSAVSLLTPPDSFEGGEFRFYDPEETHKHDLYGSLLVYSSGAANDPQLHSRDQSRNGARAVLLMFFEAA